MPIDTEKQFALFDRYRFFSQSVRNAGAIVQNDLNEFPITPEDIGEWVHQMDQIEKGLATLRKDTAALINPLTEAPQTADKPAFCQRGDCCMPAKWEVSYMAPSPSKVKVCDEDLVKVLDRSLAQTVTPLMYFDKTGKGHDTL